MRAEVRDSPASFRGNRRECRSHRYRLSGQCFLTATECRTIRTVALPGETHCTETEPLSTQCAQWLIAAHAPRANRAATAHLLAWGNFFLAGFLLARLVLFTVSLKTLVRTVNDNTDRSGGFGFGDDATAAHPTVWTGFLRVQCSGGMLSTFNGLSDSGVGKHSGC